jgi:hypothetical protein
VAVVILHVYKIWHWLLLNLSRTWKFGNHLCVKAGNEVAGSTIRNLVFDFRQGYKSVGQSVSLTLEPTETSNHRVWEMAKCRERTAQHSTAQHSTAQHSTAQHSTQWHLHPKLRKCGSAQDHSHSSIRVRTPCVLSTGTKLQPIPVADPSKAWDWGGSLVVITGSSLAGGYSCSECRVFSGRGLWVWRLITRPKKSYRLCHSVWSSATVILCMYNE